MVPPADDDPRRPPAAGAGAGPRGTPAEGGNKTLASLDLEAYRRHLEQLARDPSARPGTVNLNPNPRATLPQHPGQAPLALQESGPTHRLSAQSTSTLASEGANDGAPPITRDRILTSPVRSTGDQGRPAASLGLEPILRALQEEVLEHPPGPFMPFAQGDPFEGMMANTLEIRLPGLPGEDPLEGPTKGDDDPGLAWLSPPEPPPAQLANSYELSDEQVSMAFMSVFQGLSPASGETLLAVGRLARLESRLVDAFARVGSLWARMRDAVTQPQGSTLRGWLETLGLLADAELERTLAFWRENRHDARFFADDEGQRLKPVRLVGVYLLRRHGETLGKVPRAQASREPMLLELLRLAEMIRSGLAQRNGLIKQYFGNQAGPFSTHFLVQRGLNAQPGFFWCDPPREEL